MEMEILISNQERIPKLLNNFSQSMKFGINAGRIRQCNYIFHDINLFKIKKKYIYQDTFRVEYRYFLFIYCI